MTRRCPHGVEQSWNCGKCLTGSYTFTPGPQDWPPPKTTQPVYCGCGLTTCRYCRAGALLLIDAWWTKWIHVWGWIGWFASIDLWINRRDATHRLPWERRKGPVA